MKKIANPHLLGIMPYKPGKPIDEVARERGLSKIIKLASNENALGTPQVAIDAIVAAAENQAAYPDGYGFYLKNALSKELDVDTDKILIGNGSDELIVHLASIFIKEGLNVVSSKWSFVRYYQAASLAGGECKKIPMKNFTYDLEGILDAIDENTKLIYIANPNNPTGTILKMDEIRIFLEKIPENIVIVFDEAYYDFVNDKDYAQTLELQKEFSHLPIVTLRSFSKVYGLAGLRIGYGIVNDVEIAKLVNIIRGPFNVNSLAQSAALACIGNHEHPRLSREHNIIEKEKYYKLFEELKLDYVKSETNFLIVNIEKNGDDFAEELLKRGLIIRAMGDWGLPLNFIRISIGKSHENEELIKNLKELL